MLQVARLAPKVLGDSTSLVERFLQNQRNSDGGFKDRIGKSDLYYTVFGIDALQALQAEIHGGELASYLANFDELTALDFVHVCCLARCWSTLKLESELRARLLEEIERYRSADGGYSKTKGDENGTVYAAFLAVGAYQDLKSEVREPLRIVQALKFLETSDGAWANERGVKVGSTNATAAAVTVLRNLRIPVSPMVGEWLLARCHEMGGFVAAPAAPAPDLLSTATALHAMAGLELSLDALRDKCLDFIDSLWTNEGSFYGHWQEESLDTEYTFYALLALGHLSL